jgi:hypothetical protein
MSVPIIRRFIRAVQFIRRALSGRTARSVRLLLPGRVLLSVFTRTASDRGADRPQCAIGNQRNGDPTLLADALRIW